MKIHHLPDIKSPLIFKTNEGLIFKSITTDLLTRDLILLINDKIKLFNNKLSLDTPYTDIVGVLSGYELVSTELDCGGYFSIDEKQIAYNEGGLDTIFHELGHSLQSQVMPLFKPNLSYQLFLEQQCETINFYLKNGIGFHDNAKPYYFNRKDYLYLKNWYGKFCQDDLSEVNFS